jgi:hypothetical protein
MPLDCAPLKPGQPGTVACGSAGDTGKEVSLLICGLIVSPDGGSQEVEEGL